MINNNNIETIKKLCNKIEYTVTKTVKEARISPPYDSYAYEMLKDDLCELYGSVEKDIIAIYNHNTRDYYNIFTDKRNAQVYNDIDMKRIGLTKKQLKDIDNVYIDNYNDIVIETSKDISDVLYKKYIDIINSNIVIDEATARGYSQGDYEQYTIASYKDISKNNNDILKLILKNLSYLFTVQEYYINLVDIETRLYTSGIEEVEEVEGDSYSTVTYTGYIEKEELEGLKKQGYEIITKN